MHEGHPCTQSLLGSFRLGWDNFPLCVVWFGKKIEENFGGKKKSGESRQIVIGTIKAVTCTRKVQSEWVPLGLWESFLALLAFGFSLFFFLFAAVSHMYHVCTNTTKLQNQPGLTFFYNLMNSLSFGCFCFWMLSAVFKKSELLVAFFINFHACMYYCWIYFYFFLNLHK